MGSLSKDECPAVSNGKYIYRLMIDLEWRVYYKSQFSRVRWCRPGIPAFWESEARGSQVKAQPNLCN